MDGSGMRSGIDEWVGEEVRESEGWMDGSGIRSGIDGWVRDGSNSLQRKTFWSLLNRWVRDVSYSLQRKDFNCVMFNEIPYFWKSVC